MKIIIEIAGGMVTGVYYEDERGRIPEVFIVDLDEMGEATNAVPQVVEPLDAASDITREAVKR